MRLYSWNMYCYNKQYDNVLSLVQNAGADVFCVQEVPAPLLDRLCALYPYSHSVIDSERVYGGAELTNYNVILSRLPLTDLHVIPLDPLPLKLRTKFVILLMRPFGWARTWNRNTAVARVATSDGSVTIVSAHLTLSSPTLRAKEFRKILDSVQGPVIIGGDFNCIEFGPLKILSWLLGARLYESLPWFNERTLWEKRFTDADLVNPLRGSVTHNFSRSQLDHVLVPDTQTVTNFGVLDTLAGSDHAPIYVELI